MCGCGERLNRIEVARSAHTGHLPGKWPNFGSHKGVVIHGCTEAEINRRIDAFFD